MKWLGLLFDIYGRFVRPRRLPEKLAEVGVVILFAQGILVAQEVFVGRPVGSDRHQAILGINRVSVHAREQSLTAAAYTAEDDKTSSL